jgi:aspartate/methionine/tyrosine aminotransferase
MFSNRTSHFEGILNRLYRQKEAIIKEGKPFYDLISASVHHHGIQYPQAILNKAFKNAVSAAKIYRPDSAGQLIARMAIQKYYMEEGIDLPFNQIVLTPGTSVSYQYLFQLFANPSDEILCPIPSYPLFDSIAALTDVKITSYHLVPFNKRWVIDFNDIEKKITQKTRAIVLISPHNPTGAVATPMEMERLCDIALRFNLPIISDEVFSPFLINANKLPRPLLSTLPAGAMAPLVLILNGISKMLALPGIKVSWIGILGDSPLVKKTIRILHGISDTFLPVNELAQFALPTLVEEGRYFQKYYQEEIKRRYEIASSILSSASDLSFCPSEGGFYITVKMKNPKRNEEQIALNLLEKEGILVHPGYFYGLSSGHLVMSFISKPALLKKHLEKIIRYCQ